MRRKPRGYAGGGHVTIGSDILAVTRILRLPEQVLGMEIVRRLDTVEPDGWYPIEWLLELMDLLDQHVGHYGLLRMGRVLFQMSHKKRVQEICHSARDVIYGIDDMYHFANRGREIGGWKVTEFKAGYAELEKTTPHHCTMEQGILAEALSTVGCPGIVSQRECFRSGADVCVYTITSSFTDEHWWGVRGA